MKKERNGGGFCGLWSVPAWKGRRSGRTWTAQAEKGETEERDGKKVEEQAECGQSLFSLRASLLDARTATSAPQHHARMADPPAVGGPTPDTTRAKLGPSSKGTGAVSSSGGAGISRADFFWPLSENGPQTASTSLQPLSPPPSARLKHD